MRRGRYDDHATVQAFATFERETFAAGVEAAAKTVEDDGIWSEGYMGCAAAIRNLTPASET